MLRKITLIKKILLLILILGTFQSYAKVYSSRNFTTEDGLPTSEIYSVLQDDQGYMWFATDRGAVRFDGNEFEVFTTKDGLTSDVIFRLFKDKNGRIWFVAQDSQLSYYENGEFHLYPYNDIIKKEVNTPTTTSFYIDSLNGIHLGYQYSGYLTIDCYGNSKHETKSPYRYNINRIENNLLQYRTSTSDPDNIRKVKFSIGNQQKIVPIPYKEEIFYLINATTTTITNNTFYFAIGNELLYYEKDSVKRLKVFSSSILQLYETESSIWIGFLNIGYTILDKKTGKIRTEFSLKEHSISNFYEDKDKGFWITTLENGIYYYPNINIESYTVGDGLPSNSIFYLAGNSTHLIITDYGGNIAVLNLNSQKYDTIIKPTNSYRISKKSLYNQYTDKLYIHYYGKLTNILNNNTILKYKRPIRFYSFYNEKSILAVKSIKGEYFFGLYESDEFTLFNVETLDYQYDLQFVRLKNSGRIMIGHKTGLYEIVREKEKYRLKNFGKSNPLFSVKITTIAESNQYDFIVATRGEGVLFVKNNIPFAIKKKHGLVSNQITSLFVDSDQTVWVGSKEGLSIISPDRKITNLKWEDGLISNEITDIFVSKERAYIGTKKGLTVLVKKSLIKDPINIPVLFKKITLDNNRIITPKNNAITIELDEPVLNIKFIGICYRSMGKIDYKYRLNKDENWQYTTNNKLQFINLSSGEYHLEIYASNGNGKWSKSPAILTIQVAYPFWKTIPFILFSIFLFFSFLLLIYKSSLIRVKKREMLKRQIQSLRFEALSAQMNPHFIFNSLNSIQNFIMMNEKKESIMYLSKFAKLMRKTLDHSQMKNISLEEEINALILYLNLEALRFDGLIKYEIEIGLDIDTADIILPALLIQPIVENAILHGLRPKPEGGLIKITFHKKNVRLVIKIEDNGIGRNIARKNKKDDTHQSKGNSLTKDRVALFAKEFYANYIYEIEDLMADGEGIGTIVRIGIPYIVKKHDNTQSNNN